MNKDHGPTSAEREALLPCPFCGRSGPAMALHEAHSHGIATFMPDAPESWTIECKTANCCALIASTKADVVAAWNRRAAMQTAEPVGYVEATDIDNLRKWRAAGVKSYVSLRSLADEFCGATTPVFAAPDRAPSIATDRTTANIAVVEPASAPSIDSAAGWQPIETAPTEKRFLACCAPIEKHRLVIAWKTNIGLILGEDLQPLHWPMTHWQPLPPPPAIAALQPERS